MDLKQAQIILGVTGDDDSRAVKRKYYRLMADYHPDAVGSEEPEHIRRAQEINEAYQTLKIQNFAVGSGRSNVMWQGRIQEQAFCEREIYLYYSMEVPEEALYYQAAKGKYMWDPDAEEFELFLVSIRQASQKLLDQTEDSCTDKFDFGDTGSGNATVQERIDRYRFGYQAKLFDLLARQYIHPAKTLENLYEPERMDGKTGAENEGRVVYRFRAYLHAKTGEPAFRALTALKPGEGLYPASFCGNKIAVMNKEKQKLGFLSLQEDVLYFCVIPLLKARLAQVKLVVRAVGYGRRRHPDQVKAEVDFYFRLEAEAADYEDKNLNRKIADVLAAYESCIRGKE